MNKKTTIFSRILSLVTFFALPLASFTQDGSLDLTFGNDGIVVTSIGSSDEYGRSMVLQSDGKLVVAGEGEDGSVFAIFRYNTNGSLDNAFDSDGMVTTSIGSSSSRAYAVALQSDGKIVVAGYSYGGTDNDFAIVRYNTDGSLDNEFDSDGIVTTNFEEFSNDRAFSIAIQSDGKIVASGYNTSNTTDRDFALARYNTNGSLDNTFNSTGIVSTPIEIGVDEGRSVNIQSDGKIVVTGFSFDFSTRKFTLVRYHPDGMLDNTFNGNGIVTTQIGPFDDAAYAAAIQSDGKIVAVGYTSGETYDIALIRYLIDGSLDNTFDSDGIVVTSIGASDDIPFSIAMQGDGKILVAGHSLFADNNFAMVRYNTNGSPDNSFDSDGMVTTEIGSLGSDDMAQSIVLQADGKIVLAGSTSNGSNYDFALARYNNSNSTGINFTDQTNTEIKIFPNPFSKTTTLQSDVILNDATLTVCNSLGEIVKQIKKINGQTIILHRDNLQNGLYFFKIEQDDTVIYENKLSINN